MEGVFIVISGLGMLIFTLGLGGKSPWLTIIGFILMIGGFVLAAILEDKD